MFLSQCYRMVITFRRLLSLLGIVSMMGTGTDANASIDLERKALESRVNTVKELIQRVDKNVRAADRAGSLPDQITQWYPWGNWNNWGNWQNWRNF